MKQRADFDTTYCNSITCKSRCWRHVSNFEFEEGKNYWFQDRCINSSYSINCPVNEKKVEAK